MAAIGLKIQKFAERVGAVTASRLKAGIRDLRKVATAQIRQLMQTLAGSGYGSVQGEGAEMTYVPAPGDQQLQLDLSAPAMEEIDIVDPQLMNLSVHETEAGKASQAGTDTIDGIHLSLTPATDVPSSTSGNAQNRLEEQAEDAVVMAERAAEFSPKQSPEDDQAKTSDTSITQPPSFRKGQKVELWRQEQWLLATYLRPISHSILSHRTHRLDDGHQVEVLGSTVVEGLLRVALSDLRPWLDLSQPNPAELNPIPTD